MATLHENVAELHPLCSGLKSTNHHARNSSTNTAPSSSLVAQTWPSSLKMGVTLKWNKSTEKCGMGHYFGLGFTCTRTAHYLPRAHLYWGCTGTRLRCCCGAGPKPNAACGNAPPPPPPTHTHTTTTTQGAKQRQGAGSWGGLANMTQELGRN